MEKGEIDVIEILEDDVKHETECVPADSTLCLYDPEKRQPSQVIVLIVFTSIIMSALFNHLQYFASDYSYFPNADQSRKF